MEKSYVYFSEKALRSPLVMGRTQNTIVVCDSRTGELYRATGLYDEPDACMLRDKVLLAVIEQNHIIHFETYKGAVSDFALVMRVSDFKLASVARIMDAKLRFDLDRGWATFPAALDALVMA
jgi:hypothetical protein